MNSVLINPYVRYAGIMPGIMDGVTTRRAYDCRLFYVLEGNAVLYASGVKYPIRKGTAIYLPTACEYNIEGEVKTLVLNFDLTENAYGTEPKSPVSTELFDENGIFDHSQLPSEYSSPMVWNGAEETESAFQDCLRWKNENKKNSDLVLSGSVKVLLGKISEQTASENGLSANSTARKILLHVKLNYDKNLNSAELSKVFGYHPYHLNRLFREAYGKTIHQAVIGERIRIAKHLLKRTDLTVEKITTTVGFADRVSFYYAFRKETGVNPIRYREESRSAGST